MTLLLAAATVQEMVAAVPHLSPQNLIEHQLTDFWVGKKQWMACITGVGPVNAGIALGRALAHCPQCTGMVNIGLAGSFDLTIAPLGSTMVVREEIWPEYGLADEHGVDAAALGFPLWCGPSGPHDTGGQKGQNAQEKQTVIDRLSLCVQPHLMGLASVQHLPQGIALTVAGVSNSVARAARLQQRYAPLVENMEGFAVALACARQGLPLLELRTISNVVGSRQAKDRDFPLAFTALQDFFMPYVQKTQ